MTIRKDILLNVCGDEKIENGDLVLVDGPDQIRQSWLIHIRTILGEIITNTNLGMPWFEPGGILDKHKDLKLVEQYFIDGSLEVPGVTAVNGVTITVLDANARTVEISVDCTIEADEGEENQTFNYQGNLPLGTCSATSDEDFPLTIDGLRVWFDAQDLSNTTNQPSVPLLRLENKAGAGYALGVGNNNPELLVDGDMEAGPGPEELTDGDMEAGPGPELMVDGDQEAVGVGAYSVGNSATLTKDVTAPHSGVQNLRVAYNSVNNPYAYQTILTSGISYHIDGWAKGDGTYAPAVYCGATLLWTGAVTATWQNFVIDFVAGATTICFYSLATGAGFSEFDDISVKRTCPDWTAGNSALLTKSTASPHGGTQALRIAYNGVSNPQAYQTGVVNGKSYYVHGWARSDGTVLPKIDIGGGGVDWTGTTSTSWQEFEFSVVADASAGSYFRAGTISAGYVEFDDVSVKETCPDWIARNSGLLTKEAGGVTGNCLRVTYNGVSYPGARQNVLTVGKSYRVTGWARSDTVYGAIVYNSGPGTLWSGSTSGAWEQFDVNFVAGSTYMDFQSGATTAGYSEFDDVSVIEGGPGFPTLVGVTPLNNKRAIYLNNTLANINIMHLAFYDTMALRPGGGDFTAFVVAVMQNDGSSTYNQGIFALRGQNDTATREETNVLNRNYPGALSVNAEFEAYSQHDAAAAAASYETGAVSNPYDPFYAVVKFLTGSNTDFYVDGTYHAGDATIITRYLDGDGFIGASVDSDCMTPINFACMYFGELLIYEGELTSDQIDLINTWLANKWGF